MIFESDPTKAESAFSLLFYIGFYIISGIKNFNLDLNLMVYHNNGLSYTLGE